MHETALSLAGWGETAAGLLKAVERRMGFDAQLKRLSHEHA